MRKVIALLLCVVMVFSFVACASNKQDPAEDNKLVIYAPQGGQERGDYFKTRIKEELGIEVEFLSAKGGELAERLIAEKGSPQADVVFGLTQIGMYQLIDEDVLTPYVPTWANGLPDAYKNKDGYFHGFWQTPIVLAYNSDFIDPSVAPKNWSDLANPEFKGKFVMGRTGSQTTRSYLTGILWNYYDKTTGEISKEGWDTMSKIYDNAAVIPEGANPWLLTKQGDLPIVLSYYSGVVEKSVTNGINIEYMIPSDGTPIVAESIGIINGTKKEVLAKKFVDWFGSKEFMSEYANTYAQAPAHPDAIALCNDEVKAHATKFTAQNIDWGIASSKMNEWLAKIELEIMN